MKFNAAWYYKILATCQNIFGPAGKFIFFAPWSTPLTEHTQVKKKAIELQTSCSKSCWCPSTKSWRLARCLENPRSCATLCCITKQTTGSSWSKAKWCYLNTAKKIRSQRITKVLQAWSNYIYSGMLICLTFMVKYCNTNELTLRCWLLSKDTSSSCSTKQTACCVCGCASKQSTGTRALRLLEWTAEACLGLVSKQTWKKKEYFYFTLETSAAVMNS